MTDEKNEEKSTFGTLKHFWSSSKNENCEKKEQEFKEKIVQEINSLSKNVNVKGLVEKINSTNSQIPSHFANPTKTNSYTVVKKLNFTFSAILPYWLGLENAHKIPKKILKIANKGTLTISLPYAVNQERGFFGVDFTNSNGKKLCTILFNESLQPLSINYLTGQDKSTTIFFPLAWQYIKEYCQRNNDSTKTIECNKNEHVIVIEKCRDDGNSHPEAKSCRHLVDEVRPQVSQKTNSPEKTTHKDEGESPTTLSGDSDIIWQKEVMKKVIIDLKNRIWYYKLFGSNKVTNLENIFNKSCKETIAKVYESFQTAAKKHRFFGLENAHKITIRIFKIANKGTLTISEPYEVNQERVFFAVDFTNNNREKLCTILFNESLQPLAINYLTGQDKSTTIFFPLAWQYIKEFCQRNNDSTKTIECNKNEHVKVIERCRDDGNSHPEAKKVSPQVSQETNSPEKTTHKDEGQSPTTLSGDSDIIWQKEVMKEVIIDLKNRIWYYKLFGSNKVTNLENIFNKSRKETIDSDYKSFKTAAKKHRFFGKETRSYKYLEHVEKNNTINGSR